MFGKKIACTQPRKVATISLAKRVSEEMNCEETYFKEWPENTKRRSLETQIGVFNRQIPFE